MNIKTLKEKYVKDLEENFISFWEKALDVELGGVFTCFTNRGDRLISDRKYIWSQGRFLWLTCHLIRLNDEEVINLSEQWREHVHKTYQFLREHALMPNYHAVFAVEKNGEKIPEEMDTSIFADCFYILGLNAYAQLEKDLEVFDHVLFIYDKIKERIQKNNFRTEPYPIPEGYRSFSLPMILINVVQEMYETAEQLSHPKGKMIYGDINDYFSQLKSHVDKNRVMELYGGDEQSLLQRYVDPGHTIECAWFVLHSLKYLDKEKQDEYMEGIQKIVRNAIRVGWDEKYGGLYRFIDKDGDKPKGELIDTPQEDLILSTWDTKLWWPHSEALYTTLLLYDLTDDEKWLDEYEKFSNYVFSTFPNEDEAIGEWIQIRDRKGNPIDKVVALPVKDPFHIIRVYIKIIELLRGSEDVEIRRK